MGAELGLSEEIMTVSNIGTFKKSGNTYVGEIITLSVQADNVRIIPVEGCPANEKHPTHRVMVGRVEIGSAWSKQNDGGREFLAVTLDDPSFNAPIIADLLGDEGGGAYRLIWTRVEKRDGS